MCVCVCVLVCVSICVPIVQYSHIYCHSSYLTLGNKDCVNYTTPNTLHVLCVHDVSTVLYGRVELEVCVWYALCTSLPCNAAYCGHCMVCSDGRMYM